VRVTWILIKLGIRFLVFGGAFALAMHRDKRIRIHPRYALPLVALVFALLNTGLYWILKPVLNLATMGAFAFILPFALNGAFLYGTQRILKPLRIEGIWPMILLSGVLTVAHGLLWVALDWKSW
jgi:hypothetical protein